MKPCKITVDLYNTFRERMPEYVQYDRNVPLEITVLENGKPADLNGLFGRLLVSKPDGHEVYNNDVEISGNVITTTLGEQVFTASGVAQVTVDILDEQNSKRALIPFGMRIRSAVITDESIKSSNDYQTITALISDVRALDAMFHVEQEQRAEAFNAQMQSQEATFTEAQRQFLADHREAMFHVEQQMTEQADMFHVEQAERAKAFEQSEADREQRFETQTTEWAQTVEQAEATRQFNEERRQSAESKRGNAEKARESAERQRVDTEAVRQRQEQERSQGEAGRTTAEANRVKAEQTRVDNESSRKSAESSRVNAESQRATAESHRATAETSRANAESQRATAETNRAGAEGRRSEAESNRVTAESNRATAESKRVTAENTRETQENARREAEEDRATRMAQWEAKAEETAQKAQEAVDSAQAFVNTNEERLLADRDKIDYMGNQHESLKAKNDADVDWLLGEINTVHYDGQHITATDTIEGRSKSAILKGQTLVNLSQSATFKTETGARMKRINLTYQSKENEKLLLKINVTKCEAPLKMRFEYGDGTNSRLLNDINNVGCYTFIISHSSGIVSFYPYIDQEPFNNGLNVRVEDINIIKYQDGMENWDIPYFTGMQSVKLPVLTTTGKNLLKYSMDNVYTNSSRSHYAPILNEDGSITLNSCYDEPYWLKKGFYVEKGKEYTVTVKGMKSGDYSALCFGFDNLAYLNGGLGKALIPANTSGNCIDTIDTYGTKKMTCTALETGYVTRFYIHGSRLSAKYTILEFQVEEGSTPTLYEPYKSNILTVNEDVTLRGIGDVQDELDLLTGEVTQYFDEVTFDGSDDENFIYLPGYSNNDVALFEYQNYFDLNISALKRDGNMMCDKFSINPSFLNPTKEGVYCQFKHINVMIEKSKLSELTTLGIQTYLKQNPIKMILPKQKSVKTVDLSDNHVYSYKGVTHYDCSSAEGSLVPTLSIDVPTNLPAVVTRQRATIQELEKENQELAHAVTIVDEHREEGDLELLSSDFDFELRLMEIEFAIGIPMMANYKGVRNMARTPYDMAKALILGGKYEREEMIAKLDRFEKLGSITTDQKAELIALMDAVELTQ